MKWGRVDDKAHGRRQRAKRLPQRSGTRMSAGSSTQPGTPTAPARAATTAQPGAGSRYGPTARVSAPFPRRRRRWRRMSPSGPTTACHPHRSAWTAPRSRYHHTEAGLANPTDNKGVRRVLRGLTRQAACEGRATRVVELLLGWIGGEPLHVRQCAILEGVTIEEPLGLTEGPRSLPATEPAPGLRHQVRRVVDAAVVLASALRVWDGPSTGRAGCLPRTTCCPT